MRYLIQFIESHFNLVLILSVLLGLILPYVDQIPSYWVIIFLGFMMFLSCFRVDFSEIRKSNYGYSLLFIAFRFVALPVVLFYLCNLFIPEYAIAILLAALMPAGVASPGLTAIFHGRVSTAFFVVVVSTLLAPFIIPAVFQFLTFTNLHIDVVGLFQTLMLSIFLPIILFGILRKVSTISDIGFRYGKSLNIIFIGLILILVIAKQRIFLFEHYESLLFPLILSFILFFLFYLCGWFLFSSTDTKQKIAYSLSSGANNAALGIALALLYFPIEVSVFQVLTEFPWMLMFIPFGWWVKRF